MNKAKFAAQVAQLTVERVPFVLATVVRARRPASVSPGDTAVVLADGSIQGFVGGQCAESSVRLYALRALETGEPMLLRLVPDGAQGDEPSDGIEGAVVEHNPCLSGGSLEIFLEPQLPPARVVITGESPIARAVEQLATVSGYAVEAGPVSDLAALAGATAVVVASHGHDEEEVLQAALSAGVPYVGLVASSKRGEAVRNSLDVPPELTAELHTPAGVDIGAETPAEIAISILAELIVVQHADPGPDRPTGDREVESMTGPEFTQEPAGPDAAPTDLDPSSAAGEPEPVAVTSETDGPQAEDGPSRRHSGAAMLERAFAPVTRDGADAGPDSEFSDSQLAASYSYGDANEAPQPDTDAVRTIDPDDPGAEAIGESHVEFAIDPVCGMKVPVVESTLHLDVGGSRKYFCGTGCRVAYTAKHAAG
jgi:xanthine dehydrogenase accessory factor